MTTKGRLLRGSSPQLGQHRPIRGGASNLAESGRQGSIVLADSLSTSRGWTPDQLPLIGYEQPLM